MANRVRIGNLRHQVQLQRRVETRNAASGEVVVGFTHRRFAWASIEPTAGAESFDDAAIQSEREVEITMRYYNDIGAGDRIVYHGKIYDIVSVLNHRELGEFATYPCREGRTIG